ncbi:MAG: glycosyl transferase, partial [Muribaculaceae bacterium]|nr:glycosyl transferase [Muribaculaceae bacterium]
CGGVWVCTDKQTFDYQRARKFFKQHLSHNYYYTSREWPYKYVKPRIFAEQYMVDESGYELKDYKFFCFDGRVEALYIASDRGSVTEETKFDFFDVEFKHLPFTNGHPNSRRAIQKPVGFKKMKELAMQLSVGYPHLRVDLYDINGQIYFGELTFYHMSGLVPFNPQEWDEIFGDWLELPKE